MTDNELRKKVITLFDYNPSTGLMTNRTSGDPCSRVSNSGYLLARINHKSYSVHRLAYLIMEGVMPDFTDHINRIKHDNRWSNLRSVDKYGSAQNVGVRASSVSRAIGVEERNGCKWRAHLCRNGARRKSKWFKSKEEAIAQRDQYEREWMGIAS